MKPQAATGVGSSEKATLPQKRKQPTDSVDSDHDREAHESDPDGEEAAVQTKPPPPKKHKTKDMPLAQENKDMETFFDLGGKKRITLREFKGKKYVDIREFYGDDSDLKPGKKGIMLGLETAATLRDVLNGLDQLKGM